MGVKCSHMRVKIPDELASRIEEVAEDKGYNGVTDFVREASRLRADELEDGGE